jgi:chemotaxis protein methyltransferase CheR
MRPADLDPEQVGALLGSIHRTYGYDFRDWARPSLHRRLRKRLAEEGLSTLHALEVRVLSDPACMRRLVSDLSIHVTSMFRDPEVYRVLRSQVMPYLRTYPYLRAWHAGCATGEEPYSMAILLEEAGIYDRSRIYATDLSEDVLAQAKRGIYPLAAMKEYTRNYLRTGGERAFSEYYTANYGSAILKPSLRRNVVFAQHDLATDGPFNEFHIVMCRNVMIYFEEPLRDRVYALLDASLAPLGYLVLGMKETLRYTAIERRYEVVDATARIYRKKV